MREEIIAAYCQYCDLVHMVVKTHLFSLYM